MRIGNRIGIGILVVPFSMISSDSAKHWWTRSIARSLCDSWASCLSQQEIADAVLYLREIFTSWSSYGAI